MPTHRVETFKERVLHPFRSVDYKELGALEDVSFAIAAAEFFGIAGRNGSGKTTLLKLLASIYAPDSGTIRIAGRVAPFIEPGVGFNPDLATRFPSGIRGPPLDDTPDADPQPDCPDPQRRAGDRSRSPPRRERATLIDSGRTPEPGSRRFIRT